MNRERAKELLPIIQAYAEGKDVQYKPTGGNKWKPMSSSVSFNERGEYRIKPEPREIFVLERDDGSLVLLDTLYGLHAQHAPGVKRFREVMEDE